MDFNNPPTILATYQITVSITTPSYKLLSKQPAGQRRAYLIVNRSNLLPVANPQLFQGIDSYIGMDNTVRIPNAAESANGFLLRPGEGISIATTAEIWGTAGLYHILELAG